jgi:hypothetical protein
VLALLCASAPALASDKLRTDFSGFGTLGGGDATGAGDLPESDIDWEYKNILGLQMNVTSTSGLGLTVQGVMRGYSRTGERPYKPDTEWFFGSWQPNDTVRLRAGRFRSPLFNYSDSLEVGYSYPWVNPQEDVYTATYSAASHLDGADITWTWVHPQVEVQVQVGGGSSETVLDRTPYEVNDARFINVIAEFDTWRIRYGFFDTTLTIDIPGAGIAQQVFLGFQSQSPLFARLAEAIDTTGIPSKTHAFGITKEWGQWTLDSEVIYNVPPGSGFDILFAGAYASLARQMGSHTIWSSVGRSRLDLKNGALDDLEATQSVIAPGTNPVLDAVRQGVARTLDPYTSNSSRVAVGYRYDITRHWDVKLQYILAKLEDRVPYDAYITPPDVPNVLHYDIVMATTDWVF